MYGTRLATRSLRSIIKKRFKQADVVGDRKTTHSLRHTAITSAIRNGANPLDVQTMACHSSFQTTLGYYQEMNRFESLAEDFISYGAAGQA
jgi:site-specific recombinase XerD